MFTTRPDTLFGMSFLALAPEHPLAAAVAARDPAAAAFIAECRRMGTSEAAIETAEKRGYDTGLTVRHPFLAGATLPGLDRQFRADGIRHRRDLRLPRRTTSATWSSRASTAWRVTPVVLPPGDDPASFAIGDEAYVGPGTIFNSGFLDGLDVEAAKRAAIAELERRGVGQGVVNWRLRDWGVSRQRYWGCPIPVIHCDACGVVPVPDDQLPVRLPDDVTFDRPGNPLDHHPTWKHVACPRCGAPARRETDTFDTFVDSSWYFARFCSPHADGAGRCARRSITGCRSISISAASSTRSCICSIRASSPARCSETGHIGVDEPFAGLFTQGMVNARELSRAPDGTLALSRRGREAARRDRRAARRPASR